MRISKEQIQLYEITADMKKRISIMKFLMIILVVYLHSYTEKINLHTNSAILNRPMWLEMTENMVSHTIGDVAVPAFFLMAAILLYRKKFVWIENLKKKCKSILVPYFLMNTFWIIIFGIFQVIPVFRNFFSGTSNIVFCWNLNDWLRAYGLINMYPFLYPLWFLKYLFIFNVFALMIKRITIASPKIVICILGVMFLFPSEYTSIVNGSYLLFWCIGCVIVNENISLDCLDNKKILITGSYLLILIMTVMQKDNMVLKNLAILLGLVFWFVCMTKIVEKIVKINILQYTFGIYLFHEMGLTFFKKVLFLLLPHTSLFLLAEYFLLPMVTIVICVFFCFSFNTFSSCCYGIVTGNRNN